MPSISNENDNMAFVAKVSQWKKDRIKLSKKLKFFYNHSHMFIYSRYFIDHGRTEDTWEMFPVLVSGDNWGYYTGCVQSRAQECTLVQWYNIVYNKLQNLDENEFKVFRFLLVYKMRQFNKWISWFLVLLITHQFQI